MPFCPKCGYEMDEDDVVCYKCGTIITKKGVDGGLHSLNNSPSSRNLGKISAIQSKIESHRRTQRATSISSWLAVIAGMGIWGWAKIVYRVDVNFALYLVPFGIFSEVVGSMLIRREINKLENELSRL